MRKCAFSIIKNPRITSHLLILLILVMFLPSPFCGTAFTKKVVTSEPLNDYRIRPLRENYHIDQISISNSINDLATTSPEAYFPNFLFYSISIANSLIDYLFDDSIGGFYRSSDQHWSNTSINIRKYTYDQAQAILALLKLSDAVINDSESEYASNIAEKTGDYLISHLFDDFSGGFYTSSSNNYKKPGINGKAIQSLLSLYDRTGNMTYRNKAIESYEAIEKSGWDTKKGGYFYLLSHSGFLASSNPNPSDPYLPTAKRVDHNAIMGEAALELYLLDSDSKFLSRAVEIYNLINSSAKNEETGLFYIGYDQDGTITEPEKTDAFVNSLVLEFLSHLYNVTGNPNYYNDFISLLNALIFNFWDSSYGGFFATYSYDSQVERDRKKYTERQFYAMRALDEGFKHTKNDFYYNIILDLMEFLNNNLYDDIHEGYYQATNEDGQEGDSFWKDKYSVTQALAIYELANLWLYSKPGVINTVWSPLFPRPQDEVSVMVAAFDVDGLSNVLFNYSLNNQPYKVVEMISNDLVGNLFGYHFNPHPHGTNVSFNIIVNDTLGNIVKRETYTFSWLIDEFPPHVSILGINPNWDIPTNTNFSIIVSAHDNPTQGTVASIRIYYRTNGQSIETSKALEHLDENLWQVIFPLGIKDPNVYDFYFEAIDSQGNFGYSEISQFHILNEPPRGLPLSIIIGGLFFALIVTPAGIYVFLSIEKKKSKQELSKIRNERHVKRRKRRKRRKRN